MKLENIERMLGKGYELVVAGTNDERRPYHAYVWLGGRRATSLNFVEQTIPEALEALNRYIGADPTPDSTVTGSTK